MIKVFTTGEFSAYRKDSLNESRLPVCESLTRFNKRRITVFISHKHDDLGDLKDILGFLEDKYDVKCYIDSRDPVMPERTSGETAQIIKKRIKQCDKFILLASNGAIASKWCNWELGFGDADKYDSNSVALFPFKRSNESYIGNEYLEIYPHIVKCDGSEWYERGDSVKAGYYVCSIVNGEDTITPLETWLKA